MKALSIALAFAFPLALSGCPAPPAEDSQHCGSQRRPDPDECVREERLDDARSGERKRSAGERVTGCEADDQRRDGRSRRMERV